MLGLYQSFWDKLLELNFDKEVIALLKERTSKKLVNPIQGDYPRWFDAYNALPDIENCRVKKSMNAITCQSLEAKTEQIKNGYQGLAPWRKGPFDMFDVYIDSEWQSFMKWNRIEKKLPNLKDKIILDVGCGNGYYLFRMAELNPLLLMGIDPGLLQVMQFWSIEKYRKSQACVLPLGIESVPEKMKCFDVVFSMGVFYHRKSPIHHIMELSNLLIKGGSLVLETLVVDGDENTCLLPSNRYAQMRNVWFLPSIKMLEIMLKRNGFENIDCIDVTETTTQEQRTTKWMPFHSLNEFLNKSQDKTIEGYAVPKRATLVAIKK